MRATRGSAEHVATKGVARSWGQRLVTLLAWVVTLFVAVIGSYTSAVFHVRPGLPPTLMAAGAVDHLVPFDGHTEIVATSSTRRARRTSC
jgi:hypothetical protein